MDRGYAARVTPFRRLVAAPRLATLLLVATLLLRLIVPTGYMIGFAHGGATIMPCSGIAAGPSGPASHGSMAMAMAMPGDAAPGHADAHHGKDHGKAEMPCAFSGLSAAALGAIDPIQLALLIAFIAAMALRPRAPAGPARRHHLRPPLRGPPALR